MKHGPLCDVLVIHVAAPAPSSSSLLAAERRARVAIRMVPPERGSAICGGVAWGSPSPRSKTLSRERW